MATLDGEGDKVADDPPSSGLAVPRSFARLLAPYNAEESSLFVTAAQLFGVLLMSAFGAVELFMRQGKTAKSVRPPATDRGTSVLIVVAYALTVVAVATHVLPTIGLPIMLGWIGVAIGAMGFAFRLWAMRVLGRFYTRTLVTTADQRVVRAGPYRLVRHPGYLSSMLVWIGAAMSSANLASVLAVAVLLTVAYAHRIRTEERMLIEALGEPYAEYCRKSWRLVPFVF
jgi:protein-S-isoprenylcysteine O-methyltransferase Ste14